MRPFNEQFDILIFPGRGDDDFFLVPGCYFEIPDRLGPERNFYITGLTVGGVFRLQKKRGINDLPCPGSIQGNRISYAVAGKGARQVKVTVQGIIEPGCGLPFIEGIDTVEPVAGEIDYLLRLKRPADDDHQKKDDTATEDIFHHGCLLSLQFHVDRVPVDDLILEVAFVGGQAGGGGPEAEDWIFHDRAAGAYAVEKIGEMIQVFVIAFLELIDGRSRARMLLRFVRITLVVLPL